MVHCRVGGGQDPPRAVQPMTLMIMMMVMIVEYIFAISPMWISRNTNTFVYFTLSVIPDQDIC
jgi:hypothetical protein